MSLFLNVTYVGAAGLNEIFDLHANASPVLCASLDGDDDILGTVFDDLLGGGTGKDLVFGNSGTDTIYGDNSPNPADLTGGSDLLIGAAGDDVIFGGAGTDLASGDAGNDFVNGGTGGDFVWGGLGADNLHGGADNDEIWGGTPPEFFDYYFFLSFTVTHTGVTGVSSDIPDFLVDSKTVLPALVALAFDDPADDELNGGSGDDVLFGGLGNDILIGGPGHDTFTFFNALDAATNVDTIEDFSHKLDKIALSTEIFTKIKSAVLKDTQFVVGPKAEDAKDRIIYNPNSGKTFYDEDGTGSKAKVLFAILPDHLSAIGHDDFVVIPGV